jgi:head-tail adaptor
MRIGQKRFRVFLQTPIRTPDGTGGYTETWGALATDGSAPLMDGTVEWGTPVWVGLQAATAQNVERVLASAVQGTISYLVTLRDRRDVTLKARIRWLYGAVWKTLLVRGVQPPTSRPGADLVLACEEVL